MLRHLAICLALASTTPAAAAPLIELTTAGKAVQGRQLASNKDECWLVDIDGRLVQVKLASVTAFRQVTPEFKSRPIQEVKKNLAAELGTGFEVAVRGGYVVAAPRGKADQFAALFDQVSREFLQYLRVRKFAIVDPDVPLVAIVFPTRDQFLAQCAKDGVTPGAALRGYYHPHSNRVMLYDDPADNPTAGEPARSAGGRRTGGSRGPASMPSSHEANSGPIDSSTPACDTAVHEAIHQLAFNSGLHSRIGNNPLWVVEGLAMQFERGQDGYLKTRTSTRVNVPRIASWSSFQKDRQPQQGLSELIASDDSFRQSPVDTYSEAWLFTNYLIETRARKFSWYLQTLATRNPLDPYPPEERLRDFQENFKEDMVWLEIEYVRYGEKVAAEALSASELDKKR
ncbi:hypothetical protein Pan44_31090 [Caulifigura coniformis]|uniref:DUF1570 domain-containing protein n=1 Tax=Caulifigura coniformis TaxID=2527983 RepID=A0A517SG09_9PLAN|nr:DUF1570 domain-containing protein [Caulifigura coniformis]QDT55068.1 hypothetical protein Pan44_31090 [Caulifigura coniformis]